MSSSVIVRERARENLRVAFEWYEEQRNGLGEEFLDEWETAVEFLLAFPDSCRKRYKNFRLAGIKRFPYVIVYELIGSQLVVFNVIYAGRKPRERFR